MYMYRRELIQIATVRTVHNKNEADDQRSHVAGTRALYLCPRPVWTLPVRTVSAFS